MTADNAPIATEDEWLASTHCGAMALFVRGKWTSPKLRLFGCACCRRIWHLLPHGANRDLVATVEDHPNGRFEDPDLNAAIIASSRAAADDSGWLAVKYLGRTFYKVPPAECIGVAALVACRVARVGGDKAAEFRAQADLFRDVFGNPFRSVRIDPAWLQWNNGAVEKLARWIYDERAFDHLPMLALALTAAGCTNADVLAHCQGPGPHVRGCWVIDSLLSKE